MFGGAAPGVGWVWSLRWVGRRVGGAARLTYGPQARCCCVPGDMMIDWEPPPVGVRPLSLSRPSAAPECPAGTRSDSAQAGAGRGVDPIVTACRWKALDIAIEGTTFFLGRETLVASDRPGMPQWRETLFAFMSRNALRATAFFKIPANQVFEVGAEVEL